jgi:acetyl-CoA C-acetyltransferase
MEPKEVVIVSACRTPIGDFLGSLKDVTARELAILAGKECIRRAGIDAEAIDEIVMGQVYGAMQGSLPAKQVGGRIGLANRVGACVVNQNCASSMRAMEIACHNIMLGKTEIALVIGVESMSNAPYLLPMARTGYRMNSNTVVDHMIHDALVDELVPGHMGVTADNVAETYGICRRECDELACLSHRRAAAAIDEGRFKREIVPVEVRTKKGVALFDADEHPRKDVSVESLAKLLPAFTKEGVTTAGNASGINDAAAAAVIISREKASALGLKPLLKLLAICSAGVEPHLMGIGPAYSIPKCLAQAGMKFEDVDYWEINEAFAAQFLGVGRVLKKEHAIEIDIEKINRNGSGIALGHPIGCTGLRLITSLYYEMDRLDLTVGGASLCVGSGPSMASLWTREV